MSRPGAPNPKRGPIVQAHRRALPSAVIWEGEVQRLAWGGLGISSLEDGRKLLLESPLALFPGEIVRASIRHKSRHAEGRVISWIKPSPLREPPTCPLAGICGGCDLQCSGSSRSGLKRIMVEDLFHRMLQGHPWEWMAAPLGALRHRIQPHWDGKRLGFCQRKKHTIAPLDSCPAAMPIISGAIPRLEEAIVHRVLPTRPQRWELVTGTPPRDVFAVDETQRAWLLEPDGWHRCDSPVLHHFSGQTIAHRPGGFFQVSAAWAMEAFQKVLFKWGLHGDTLYDLYGGVGLFSMILTDRFSNFVLVESDLDAAVYGRQNLANARLPHQCIESDVTAWMPENLGAPGDTVLLDPPRAGLPPELVEKLLCSKAGALVLVGCDGAAFCRDVKRLSLAWEAKEIAVIDMFPETVHVECVGLMINRAYDPK